MLRNYICDACEMIIEKTHKNIHSPLLKKCPQCKGKVYQDLTGIYHYNSCRTIGSLAEKNTSKSIYEVEDRKRADKIQTGMNKFNDAVSKGVIEKEQAEEMIKKNIDYKPPWGELDGNKKKEIFSGSNDEQAKKVKKYIEKGQ